MPTQIEDLLIASHSIHTAYMLDIWIFNPYDYALNQQRSTTTNNINISLRTIHLFVYYMVWFREITQTHTIIDNDTHEPETEPSTDTSWNWNIETILLELLFTYNKFCIHLTHRIQTMNNTYAIARYITSCIQALSLLCGFIFRFMFFTETKRYSEPGDCWVNVVCLYCTFADETLQTPTTHEHFLDTNPTPDTSDAQYYIEETYRNYDYTGVNDFRRNDVWRFEGELVMERGTSVELGKISGDEQFTFETPNAVSSGILQLSPSKDIAKTHYMEAFNTANCILKDFRRSEVRYFEGELQNEFRCIIPPTMDKRVQSSTVDIAEIVVWSKDTQRDEQIVKVYDTSRTNVSLFPKDILYSNVEFLHIEYRHPKMGEVGIEIKLPKQLMIVGNELFSPAFLYRWMKYFSNDPIIFDEAYCVYLMDDNVNQHILRYGDYILLGKTNIEIVRKRDNKTPTTEVNKDKPEQSYTYDEEHDALDKHENEDEYETVEHVNK